MGNIIMGLVLLICFIALILYIYFKDQEKREKEIKEDKIKKYLSSKSILLFILNHYVKVYGFDSEVEEIIHTIESGRNMTDVVRSKLIEKIKQLSNYEEYSTRYNKEHESVYITYSDSSDIVNYKDSSFYLSSLNYPTD